MTEDEEPKSLLYKLKPIYERLPSIKKPDGHVHFKTKMFWLVIILILYFILTNVMIYGLDQEQTIDLFESYRAIMAGAQGSLMHLGIGPIVTGSIIMQLFVGAKIIKLDLKDDEDKQVYQGVQKFLVIIMIVVEAVPQVYGYLIPSDALNASIGVDWARILVIGQLCFGSYLVFLMDETVSKWGIGSGISLFIAAGVAQQMFTGTLNWMPVDSSLPTSVSNPPAGALMKTVYYFTHVSSSNMSGGYFQRVLIEQPNPIVALVGTLTIFFFVAYVESVRIELPLSHESARGARGRYPIKLIYASNIPVILIAAVLANVGMFAMLFWSNSFFSNVPFLGHNAMLGHYAEFGTRTTPQLTGGAAWYVSTINGLQDWLLPIFDSRYLPYYTEHVQKTMFQVMARLFLYLFVMIVGSVMFAKFWIDTTNMGPKAVAEQIQDSGMQIPGFRRDPRVLEKVLERYIPVVTVLSGAIVGGLAAFADMLGTVGNSSGTGVLLSVGIMIQTYEAMGREQMMEMHPVLRGFFGGE